MAQGVALRLHAEDAGHDRVAMHPTAHPLLHEGESLPAFTPDEVRDVVARLAGPQPASAPSRSASSGT